MKLNLHELGVMKALACGVAFTLMRAVAADFSSVEPLLQQHCVECHGAKDPEGGLDLETAEGIAKGGQSGALFVAGKSGESLLIKALLGSWGKTGKNQFMPPGKREHLKPAEVEVFKAWIEGGAPGPKAGAARRELTIPKIEPRVAVRRPVNALAYEPKNRWLAVARTDGIELIDVNTRKPVRVLKGSAGAVNALVFSADGQSLYAAGGQPGQFGEWRQWTVADGTLVRAVEGHRDALYAMALSTDGNWLATGSYDYGIQLWDPRTGKSVRTISANQGSITALSFRPNGRWLASASFDRTAKLFRTDNGERSETFGQALKELNAAVFTPDGMRLLTAGNDTRIRVYRVSDEAKEGSNELESTVVAHEGSILRLALSADGRVLASGGEDHAVKLFELPGVKQRLVLEKQPDWPTALAFLAEDRMLAVGRADGSLGYYQVSDGKPAAPPKPELTRTEPRGIQRGRPMSLQLIGRTLEDVTAVLVYRGDLIASIEPERRDGSVFVTLEPSATEARGPWELALFSASGESGRVKIWIDDLPQTSSKDGVHRAPVAVWGSLVSGTQVDEFSVEVSEGETRIFDVQAKELGSKANATLAILDAQGRTVGSNDDYLGSDDPFLMHTFTAAGRYRVRVAEQGWQASSADHFYRLTMGVLPFMSGVYPLGVPARRTSMVQRIGCNLPDDGWITVEAGEPGELRVPADATTLRSRRPWSVQVLELPSASEHEPNDTPATAQKVMPPIAMDGRFDSRGTRKPDVDHFVIEARKGQRWVIEALAASRGSLADTSLEILTTDGRPVERVRLRAVRDSAITFRNETSDDTGIRFENWEEMELNDYLYANGEVMKILRAPQGPDSDTLLYSAGGKRRGFFDTSPMAHPLEQAVYVVEPLATGVSPVPNGLPVFSLPYANDDDSERRLGTDARLYFTAPADGGYVIRVADSRGFTGAGLVYQLRIRPQQPEFKISTSGVNPTVARGSGQSFTLSLERRDGFDGPVRVEVNRVPAGWTLSNPLVIEAGHEVAVGTIHASADAKPPTEAEWDQMSFVATAEVDGRPMAMAVPGLGRPKLVTESPKLLLTVEPLVAGVEGATKGTPRELVLAPGTTVRAKLTVVRNGFDGAVRFEAQNLPHGVIVDNLGLNGITLLTGENERELFLTCARWVADQDRVFHLEETAVGRQTSLPVLLKVRRNPMQARSQ